MVLSPLVRPSGRKIFFCQRAASGHDEAMSLNEPVAGATTGAQAPEAPPVPAEGVAGHISGQAEPAALHRRCRPGFCLEFLLFEV
jgi:hypothetical protein